MIPSELTASDRLTSPIKVYRLSDRDDITQIIFYPQAPDSIQSEGVSRLEYQGIEGCFTFQGEEITQQESRLGSLITVTLLPDADAGELALTIVLPPINLAGENAQEFETVAVKTRTLGFVVDRSGAQLKYEVLNLKGVAQADSLPSDPANSPNNEPQGVTVTEINLLVLESFPPQLQITARGTVPTAGWTNPQLVPVVYVQAPPDGIYDFTFVATPPGDITAQVVTPIAARYVLPAEGIKGVRVNGKVALLGSCH